MAPELSKYIYVAQELSIQFQDEMIFLDSAKFSEQSEIGWWMVERESTCMRMLLEVNQDMVPSPPNHLSPKTCSAVPPERVGAALDHNFRERTA